MSLQPGQPAPDFVLKNREGASTKLSELLREKAVVLYFYPRDETAVCTAQACSFRDSYEAFLSAGAEVIGVSADSEQSHEKFAAHHRLPFLLHPDVDGSLRRAYDVKPAMFGLMAGRVTFVIDRQGVVRHVTQAQLSATKHVKEALEVLRTVA